MVATALIACTTPTDTSPTEIPAPVTSITILVAPSLLVHQTTLLEVRGRTARGEVSISPSEVAWTSSDASVARVSWDGIVSPLRRGSVTIRAMLQGLEPSQRLETTAQVTVKARPRMARMFGAAGIRSLVDFNSAFSSAIAVGDTIQFVALFADINGVLLDEAPTQTSWVSSAPDVVSMSASGLAVGLRHVPGSVQSWPCTVCTAVTVSTDDGPATTQVFVTDAIAGLPTTIRFAHTASSHGPLTFIPSQGDPVTLSFGQWVERSITSGTLSVHVDGLPTLNAGEADFNGVVGVNDYVSLYAVAFPNATGYLTAQWSSPSNVPADSGYVRLVAGTYMATVVYLRNLGAPVSGVAQLCYFDLGNGTEYYHRGSGDFDIVASPKVFPLDSTRITLMAAAGRKFTYVIVGDTKPTMQAIAFPDP